MSLFQPGVFQPVVFQALDITEGAAEITITQTIGPFAQAMELRPRRASGVGRRVRVGIVITQSIGPFRQHMTVRNDDAQFAASLAEFYGFLDEVKETV